MSSEEGYYTVEYLKDKKVQRGRTFYLVKWKEFDDSGCSWEPVESFQGINHFFVENYERDHPPKKRKSERTKSPAPTNNKRKSARTSIKSAPLEEPVPKKNISAIKVKVKELEIPSESEAPKDEIVKTESISKMEKVQVTTPMSDLPVKMEIDEQEEVNTPSPEAKDNEPIMKGNAPIPLKEISPAKDNMIDYTTLHHGVLGKDSIDRIEGMKLNNNIVYVDIAWKERKGGIKPYNSVYTLDEVKKYDHSPLANFLSQFICFYKN